MAPLDGIEVLDFSTLLPGPLATLLLAEAGASVTKIERPGRGDEMRSYEPRFGHSSANFALLNRGKRSVAVDLKDPEDRARLDPLLERADVIVEQFRPGVMDRLGLGYESIAERNPGIVYCSVTGYGQTGPRAGIAAHDLNYVGDAGLLDLAEGPGGAPGIPAVLVADIGGGAYPAVMNVLLALAERERTGRGRHLDVSMAENVLPFLYWAMASGTSAGAWPARGRELLTGGSPRYRLYGTSDGRWLAAAPLEDRFWTAFCDLVELPEGLRDDAADPDATAAAVAERVAARPAAEWETLLEGRDVCVTIVRSVQEALEDEHFAARGVLAAEVSDGDGRTIPAIPVPLDRGLRAAPGVLGAPALGELDLRPEEVE